MNTWSSSSPASCELEKGFQVVFGPHYLLVGDFMQCPLFPSYMSHVTGSKIHEILSKMLIGFR